MSGLSLTRELTTPSASHAAGSRAELGVRRHANTTEATGASSNSALTGSANP